MKPKINFILLSILLFLNWQKIDAQQQFKSVYKYSGLIDSINISNKTLSNFDDFGTASDIKLSVGDLVYVSHCNDSVSNIDVKILPNAGIQLTDKNGNEISGKIITDFNYGFYFSKDDKNEKYINYYLPEITNTGIIKTVNGFESSLYTYKNGKDLYIELWYSKSISDNVNIGFNYKKYGGLVKISYFTDKYSFSFSLVDFAKEKQDLEKLKYSELANVEKKKIHPMFTVD